MIYFSRQIAQIGLFVVLDSNEETVELVAFLLLLLLRFFIIIIVIIRYFCVPCFTGHTVCRWTLSLSVSVVFLFLYAFFTVFQFLAHANRAKNKTVNTLRDYFGSFCSKFINPSIENKKKNLIHFNFTRKIYSIRFLELNFFSNFWKTAKLNIR